VTLTKSYLPYGEELSSSGVGASSYGFTGEWTDMATGLVFLRARYYSPWDGRFLSSDPWSGEYNQPLTLNGWSYVENDPNGSFSVPITGVPPSKRASIMEEFKDYIVPDTSKNGNFHMTNVDFTLKSEIDFVNWMVISLRLNDEHPDNWWSQVNSYVTMSRQPAKQVNTFTHLLFPCFEYSDLAWSWGGPFTGVGEARKALNFVNSLGLEPAVKEWVYFIWFTNYAKEEPYEVNVYDSYLSRALFWDAHNAGIREGVDRATSVRHLEDFNEQLLINYVLYNVLYPGDRCADGDTGMCEIMNQWLLNAGAFIYPNNYPATKSDLVRVKAIFGASYIWWGVPHPDPDMDNAEHYRIVEPLVP
jgi:RHS repeat-associated protein